MELTPEQEFNVQAFKLQSETMTTEQLKTKLIEIYTCMIYLDNKYKEMIKTSWGLK